MLKNKKNQELWKIYTDIPLPNWPIITRWGTWVSCAIYISNNRNNIKKILNSLEKSYYNEIKKYVNCSELNFELDEIGYFDFIPEKIKLLEGNKIDLHSSLNIYLSVRNNLKNEEYINEFDRIYSKNYGLKWVVENFLNKNIETLGVYKWLPITSVDAERSFSKYKNIYSDLRTSLASETIYKMFLIMN